MDRHGLTELVPIPARGRVFEGTQRAGFSDTSPSGRVRLDALARWLQDVAYADVADAGLAESAVWVVRRTRICVKRFPRFAEMVKLATFCSGFGRMWAERRTSIWQVGGPPEADVEAVSLWVHLDAHSWRPAPFSDRELVIYGDAANGRHVTARLRHPRPPSGAEHRPWRFRATECDIAGHVNNAAYWIPLEDEFVGSSLADELLGSLASERAATVQPADDDIRDCQLDAEIEYRAPAQPGAKQVLREDRRRWIVGDEGAVHASLLVARLA